MVYDDAAAVQADPMERTARRRQERRRAHRDVVRRCRRRHAVQRERGKVHYAREFVPAAPHALVLGGGGHVGLPLSLAFAARRPAGRRSTTPTRRTLERIGRGEMPFRENGADELLAEVLPTGRLALSADAGDGRPRRRARRRHRDAGRRVPGPVDDAVREDGRPDRAAPARRGAGRPAQHRLPGDDRLRRAGASRNAAARSTSRSARSGSPRATRSRSSGRLPQIVGRRRPGRRRPGGGALRPAGRRDRPDHARRRPSWRSSSRTPGAT